MGDGTEYTLPVPDSIQKKLVDPVLNFGLDEGDELSLATDDRGASDVETNEANVTHGNGGLVAAAGKRGLAWYYPPSSLETARAHVAR